MRWTLNPGTASSCSAVWIVQNVSKLPCLKAISRFQSSNSNQQQPPLPLLIGDMRCRCSTKQSFAVGACNDFASFSDSLKYFHTADVFAALVHASIWSCHIIVRYNLFGLFAYSAKHWKSFFRLLNIRCIPSWIYILFLNVTHLCLYIYITNASLLSCLMQQAFGYLWWRLASKGHSTKKEVRTVFCIAISSKVLQIWFACLCAKR